MWASGPESAPGGASPRREDATSGLCVRAGRRVDLRTAYPIGASQVAGPVGIRAPTPADHPPLPPAPPRVGLFPRRAWTSNAIAGPASARLSLFSVDGSAATAVINGARLCRLAGRMLRGPPRL